MALITRLNGEGQTIVMVTHNPAIAAAAGRIVRMRDGRIDARASAGAPAAGSAGQIPGHVAEARIR
jgi:ABC-type lipoprotein export system ATPase subunit